MFRVRKTASRPVAVLATSAVVAAGIAYISALPASAAPPPASTTVVVHEKDVKNLEDQTTYKDWHEGGSDDASEVFSDGLHLALPGTSASTVIKGTTVYDTNDNPTPPFDGNPADLVTEQQLENLIAAASFATVSGSVNFQIPIHYSNTAGELDNFTTLLSDNFTTAGQHSFALTDNWRSSRALGSYLAFQDVQLQDLLDYIFTNYSQVWVAGYGVQADNTAIVSKVQWNDTEYQFFQPITAACSPSGTVTATNQDSNGWTFGETRSTGHNDFVANGINVWTEGSASTDKAAGYKSVNIPLGDIGIPTINLGASSGSIPPSIQLVTDFDNDGVADGILVGESTFYGNDYWVPNSAAQFVKDDAPSHASGYGSSNHGTLDAWLIPFPDAHVLAVGYSLGSGVLGNFVIESIEAGCTSFAFESDATYPSTTTQVVDDSEIFPIEDYVGWGDGYGHNPRSYSTESDGLHMGNGHATQIIKTLPALSPTTDLEGLVTGGSVKVVSGSVTYQIAIHYGDSSTFTTLRSTSLTGATNNFSVTDTWVSTRALVENGNPTPVTGTNYEAPLADLIAFFNAQGNVKIQGFGVQADTSAIVQDFVFDGVRYVFVPTQNDSAIYNVAVPESAIQLNETQENYTQWHEGYSNVTKSFSVDLNGLNLGSPSHSQVLKGLTTLVNGSDLYQILSSEAGITVVSGSVTYQVPVTFGTGGWSTLRSLSLTAGTHTFSLSDQWQSSRAIGSTINANTSYALSDIIDAMIAEGSAKAIGFGVQANSAAQVSSIRWGDTNYNFIPSIIAATPSISGTPKVGQVLTADPTAASWTPASGLTFSYQWNADGAPISGATSSTYTLSVAELGKTISVTVTGSLTGYDPASATSLGTAEVENGPITVSRLWGADRYATAVAISQQWSSASVVYIANGVGYPDALSAGPAAAHNGAPLLLTTPTSLPAVVVTELNRLQPSQIVIVGGPGVVSASVQTALENLTFGPTVTRVYGADRYATSRAIALATWTPGSVTEAYLANGTNFPDALSASPASAHFDGPVILVPGASTSVDSATLSALSTLGVTKVRIAGGEGSISLGIKSQMETTFGTSNVIRLGGADRYATSVLINQNEFTSAPTVYLAQGTGFPDALAGAALAGNNGAPLFVSLPTCIPQATMDAINALGANSLVLLGGTGVLSTAVENLTVCS